MKKITALILSLLAVLSMASCQLSEIIPPANTTAETESGSGNATESTTEEEELIEAPTYDFMVNDLTQFVTLCEYKGIKIKDESVKLTDELLDRYVGELLIAEGQFEKRRDGIINEFDVVSMDYVGKLDGVAFAGGTASDVKFLVTENQSYIYGTEGDSTITPGYGYIPGFASGMIGKPVPGPFDINVTFPENYGSQELAGKSVVFTITVNHVFTPLELNETTLKEISEEKTVDDFIKSVKEELEQAYEDIAKDSKTSKVWDYLISKCEFKALPEEYIDGLVASDFQYIEKIASMYGVDVSLVLQQYYGVSTKEEFRETIETNVKQSIIYYQILKNEGLEITEEDYNKRLDELATSRGTTAEEMEKLYTKDAILDVFRFETVNEFVFTHCVFETTEG